MRLTTPHRACHVVRFTLAVADHTHESTQVGAGMSYVRGQVHTERGELIASFVQEGLIRPMRQQDTTIEVCSRI